MKLREPRTLSELLKTPKQELDNRFDKQLSNTRKALIKAVANAGEERGWEAGRIALNQAFAFHVSRDKKLTAPALEDIHSFALRFFHPDSVTSFHSRMFLLAEELDLELTKEARKYLVKESVPLIEKGGRIIQLRKKLK